MASAVPYNRSLKQPALSLNLYKKTKIIDRKIRASVKVALYTSGSIFGQRSAKVQGKGNFQQLSGKGLVRRIERDGWNLRSPARAEINPVYSKSGVIGRQRTCRAHAGVVDLLDLVQSAGATALASPQPGVLLGSGANTVVYILGNRVLLRGLTVQGVISSWVLGSLVFSGFGARGYFIVCLYFLLGSLVTKLKIEIKEKEGTAEARGGRRGIVRRVAVACDMGSVLGSGTAGAICAILALSFPSDVALQSILRVGYVASFASKLADTVSSEIGKAYGKTTYLATSFALVPRGTEGAISLEGTAAGVVAAFLMTFVAFALDFIEFDGVVCATIASIIANYAESLIGARFQGGIDWLSNDIVNIIQISLASVLSILFLIIHY